METAKELKILMLEDSEDDRFLIERMLRKDGLKFTHECVDTRDEFIESIHRFKPDVILSDHGLPGFNSQEALKISLTESPTSSFILVTGTVSDEYAISCLRSGADDYILKSNLARLPMAVRAAVKKRMLERLKREARHALRKQNEELIKVNRELDSFFYSVSHNLRGPIASQLGLLTIAKMENKNVELEHVLDKMSRSMFKLDDTLNEIVDFARNARADLRLEQIDWSQLVQNSLVKNEANPKSKLIKAEVEIVDDIPFYSDSARISILLNNIIANAITFSDPWKESFLKLSIHTSDEDSKVVITDNGIGIREAILPKVCDMFYRGTEQSQGAGLGLYVSKEVIHRLSGEIKITSVFGKETRVEFTIPNKQMEADGKSADR